MRLSICLQKRICKIQRLGGQTQSDEEKGKEMEKGKTTQENRNSLSDPTRVMYGESAYSTSTRKTRFS